MAGLFLPDRRLLAPTIMSPRRVKPARGVRYVLDENAKSRYDFCYYPQANIVEPDLVTGKAATWPNSNRANIDYELKYGFAADLILGTRFFDYFISGARQKFVTHPVTLFAVCAASSSGSSNTCISLGDDASNRRYSLIFSSGPQIRCHNYAASSVLFTSAASLSYDTVYHAVYVDRGPTDRSSFVYDPATRQVINRTDNSTSATPNTSYPINQIRIGAAIDGTSIFDGRIFMAGYSSHAWSDARIMRWLRNPYMDLVPVV